MKAANLRWKLENIGFRLLLADNLPLQNAFGLFCEEIAGKDISYREKVLYLLGLWRKMRKGKTQEEAWNEDRQPARLREWNNFMPAEAARLRQVLDRSERVVIRGRDLLTAPVFRSEEMEKAFLAQMAGQGRENPYIFVLNEWLAGWIRENRGKKEIDLAIDKDDTLLLNFLSDHGLLEGCGLKESGAKPTILWYNIAALHVPFRMAPGYSPVLEIHDALCMKKFWTARKRPEDLCAAGYQYGGLACVGYCQWLHRLREENRYDCLVFCGRDCDVVRKVYRLLYPEEETKYLHYSRRAMGEVFFEEKPEAFLDAHFMPKVRNRTKRWKVGGAARQMGIEGLEEILSMAGISPDNYLTPQIYRDIREQVPGLYDHIGEQLRPAREAGLAYLDRLLDGKKRVCVVDLGWHGSALGHLRLFAASQNKAMEVHGALMAGTRTWQSGIWQETGILHTWLFGDDKERTDRECGLPLDRRQVFCLEKLFSSPRPTLLRYGSRENGKTIFRLRSSAPYGRSSLEVREGILAFAGDIKPYLKTCGLTVSREAAWSVLRDLLCSRERTDDLVRQFQENGDKADERKNPAVWASGHP